MVPSQQEHADALGVREQHKSKENFGKWISRNFPNLREVVSKDDQAAIIWAAEFPKNRQEISAKNSRSGV